MSCKVLLLRLHRSGLITLPEPRHINSNGKRSSRRTEQGESKENIDGPLPSLLPLSIAEPDPLKQRRGIWWRPVKHDQIDIADINADFQRRSGEHYNFSLCF